MSALPNLSLLATQASAFLIGRVVVTYVRTVVAGKDHEGVVDQFVARRTWVVRFSQGLEQSSEGDVVFKNHVLALSSFRAIRVNALPLDRSAGNRFGDGIGASQVLLEVIRCGDIVEKERGLTFALPFHEGRCFAQEIGAELSQVPIRVGQDSPFPVFHADPLHFRTLGKSPSVVSQVNPWLGIERVFGVSGDAEEFVEAMVGRAVQNRLGEIDVLEIKLVGRFPVTVVEIHPDMVFPDG